VVSKGFQLNAFCVQKFLFDYFLQLRNKRRKIAVSSFAILVYLQLFLTVSCKIFNLPTSWLSSRILLTVSQV